MCVCVCVWRGPALGGELGAERSSRRARTNVVTCSSTRNKRLWCLLSSKTHTKAFSFIHDVKKIGLACISNQAVVAPASRPHVSYHTSEAAACHPTSEQQKAFVIHLCTRLDIRCFHPFKKLALISKTNENLKLRNPSTGNLHNNYMRAKTKGEDSKTNPCQPERENPARSLNSRCLFLIKSAFNFSVPQLHFKQQSTGVRRYFFLS